MILRSFLRHSCITENSQKASIDLFDTLHIIFVKAHKTLFFILEYYYISSPNWSCVIESCRIANKTISLTSIEFPEY